MKLDAQLVDERRLLVDERLLPVNEAESFNHVL
jgi:hypothetical protein